MSQTKFWTLTDTVTRRSLSGTGQGASHNHRLYVGRQKVGATTYDFFSYLKATLDWTDVGRIVSAKLVSYTDDLAGLLGASTSDPVIIARRLTSAYAAGNNADEAFDSSDYTAPKYTTSSQKVATVTRLAGGLVQIDITPFANLWAPVKVKQSNGKPGGKATNNGIGLYGKTGHWSGWSTDHIDPLFRPQIELTYELGPTVPTTPTNLTPVGAVTLLDFFTGTFSDPRPTDKLASTEIEVYTTAAIAVGQVVTGGLRVWDKVHAATESEIAAGAFAVPTTGLDIAANVNYKWRSRNTDNEGQVSLWTGLTTFSLTNLPPTAPTITPNGLTFDTLDGVIFGGNYADTDGNALLAFQVQLAVAAPDDAIPALILWNTGKVFLPVEQITWGTSYGGPALLAGTYHWRARVYDSRGGVSDWSAVATITLSQDFNPAPGTQARVQIEPKAPWRVLIKDMVPQAVPDITLIQQSTAGLADFGVPISNGKSVSVDTTTNGHSAGMNPSANPFSNWTDNVESTDAGWGPNVLGGHADDLICRAYIDLGSPISIAAADRNEGSKGELQYATSPAGPWTTVVTAAQWEAGQDFTTDPTSHYRRITFPAITARYWGVIDRDPPSGGLHYWSGMGFGTISLYVGNGAALGVTPTPGNTVFAWLTASSKPALPAGFKNIALVQVSATGTQRYGRLCYRRVEVGDTGIVTTSAGAEVVLQEWAGVYAGIFKASSKHVATTAFRAGGNITPTRGVKAVVAGYGVISKTDTPAMSVTPLAGTTEDHDAWTGVAPLNWAGHKAITNPSGQYNVGGTLSSSKQYGGVTIVLHSHNPNRGPNKIVAVLENAKSLGATYMFNSPGEIHFTLGVDHPQIAVIEPKQVHYAVELYQRDGWREIFAGLMWDIDATETDVVYTGIDYLGLFDMTKDERFDPAQPNKPHNKGGSYYNNQTLATIVLNQLQYAIGLPNSLVNFITIGAQAVMTEKVSIYSTFEPTLSFVVGLLDSHRQGTGKKSQIKVVKTTTGYEIQTIDDPGRDRPDVRMRYGELVQGYRVVLFGPNWASRQHIIGRQRDGVKVLYRSANAPGVDPAVFGRIAQVAVADGVSDDKDLLRRLNQAALVAGKVGKQVGLGLRTGFLPPRGGYDVPDNIPVQIEHGAVHTSRYGSGYWTIYGVTWEAGDKGEQSLNLTLLPKEDKVPANPDLIPSTPISPQAEWQIGWVPPDPLTATSLYYLDQATGIVYVRDETGPDDDDIVPADGVLIEDGADEADPP